MKCLIMLCVLSGGSLFGGPVPEVLWTSWLAAYEGARPEAGFQFAEEGQEGRWAVHLAGVPGGSQAAEGEDAEQVLVGWITVGLPENPDPMLTNFLIWVVSKEGQALVEAADYISMPMATRLKQETILKVAAGQRIQDEHAIYPARFPRVVRDDPEEDLPDGASDAEAEEASGLEAEEEL